MNIEGQVSVKLLLRSHAVVQAHVASQRPALAQKLLFGKNSDAVTDLVSLVFRLCGKAQAFAASHALEQASGQLASHATWLARHQLLRMEIIREHLWRILLDWPTLMASPPQNTLMKQVLSFDQDWFTAWDPEKTAFKKIQISPTTHTLQASKVSQCCGQFLKEHVFYMPPQTFYACHDTEQFLLWAKYTETGAARFIQWLIHENLATSGDTDIKALPYLSDTWLKEQFCTKGETFMQCPSINGIAHETTPLARQKKHPLLQALMVQFGSGNLIRYVAVLLEVAQNYDDIDKASLPKSSMENHQGIGIVEAARGRLIHHVVLVDDRVETYQMVAPTEWNFHPNGVLKQALLTLKGEKQHIEKQARLLIHAMDPCVKFILEINHA